ncbi:P27 family phage terminase small subunit [Pseudomonas sp. F1_0610]|uniref:P27 family phage terminase small subunit n=1 Tax=Pseudomonas sp. F1_0610 TaxID=3114284 RepID=UPI0039C10C5F
MSGRGRKPKPTAQKILSGNAGKRALNHNEPAFSQVTHIEPPVWLEGEAVAMWERVMPELLREKVLCATDIHNVELFCSAYSR